MLWHSSFLGLSRRPLATLRLTKIDKVPCCSCPTVITSAHPSRQLSTTRLLYQPFERPRHAWRLPVTSQSFPAVRDPVAQFFCRVAAFYLWFGAHPNYHSRYPQIQSNRHHKALSRSPLPIRIPSTADHNLERQVA